MFIWERWPSFFRQPLKGDRRREEIRHRLILAAILSEPTLTLRGSNAPKKKTCGNGNLMQEAQPDSHAHGGKSRMW